MKVKDLIRQLKKMPQDAEILVYIKELGGYQNVDQIKTDCGKSFVKDYGEVVVILEEKPFISKKEQQEELVNLCPECNIYCKERFVDGQCR